MLSRMTTNGRCSPLRIGETASRNAAMSLPLDSLCLKAEGVELAGQVKRFDHVVQQAIQLLLVVIDKQRQVIQALIRRQ
ncbi:hypothetical protein SSYM_2479 [Serratia symbiotica str. Tucson]|uniref:Uncharacterized protein n=2 Tax=Serratia symbiotica TaxID=138074 RepID=E9CPL2_9GAMM|nr:hypothetical protein SSYM_2479 [Serratia symbiotica str. Tucson]BBI92031.1 uncharacterized protein SSYIS1_15390 [Serratia symbiotica]